MSDVNVATNISKNGEIQTNINANKTARKPSTADADLKASYEKMSNAVAQNKNQRMKEIEKELQDNLLMDKTLLVLLEMILLSLLSNFERKNNTSEIEKELRENEKLSKEYITAQMNNLLSTNQNLSDENKQKLLFKLQSPSIQNDMTNILNYKAQKNADDIKDFIAKTKNENPNIAEFDLVNQVMNELKNNTLYSTFRGSEVLNALTFKSKKGQKETTTTTQVQINENNTNQPKRQY